MVTQSFAPTPGQPMQLAHDLRLVLAPNPSPMTYLGTNSYILGTESLAIIDPGPDDPKHLAALLAAIGSKPVSHILVTHSHLDHSPLAGPLAKATKAPIYGFGDSAAGRSEIMKALAKDDLVAGGEGIDPNFAPDVVINDGTVIHGAGWDLTAIHTPGHIGNHLCFQWGADIFTGDHVMDWSTSLVSPPDGDLTQFMRSCEKLALIPAQRFYPGHGGPVHSPRARVRALMAHRRLRESQIIETLQTGERNVQTLTKTIYSDVAPALLPAAQRNVLAHLIDLVTRGLVTAKPQLTRHAKFSVRQATSEKFKAT